MSTSDPRAADDFDGWLKAEFALSGGFTALVVLVRIGKRKITPQRSTFLNVIGDEVAWGDLTALFAGAGAPWDGAAFFPVSAPGGGPVDNATARLRLRQVETRIEDDRLALNEGHFFDGWGRRMAVEELP